MTIYQSMLYAVSTALCALASMYIQLATKKGNTLSGYEQANVVLLSAILVALAIGLVK